MMTGAFLLLNYSVFYRFIVMLFYCLIIIAGFMNYEVLFLNTR
jgi:hypothetical protein